MYAPDIPNESAIPAITTHATLQVQPRVRRRHRQPQLHRLLCKLMRAMPAFRASLVTRSLSCKTIARAQPGSPCSCMILGMKQRVMPGRTWTAGNCGPSSWASLAAKSCSKTMVMSVEISPQSRRLPPSPSSCPSICRLMVAAAGGAEMEAYQSWPTHVDNVPQGEELCRQNFGEPLKSKDKWRRALPGRSAAPSSHPHKPKPPPAPVLVFPSQNNRFNNFRFMRGHAHAGRNCARLVTS